MGLARDIYRTLRLTGAGLRFHLGPMLGLRSRYEIAAGYQHRRHVSYFDDAGNSDMWQREVYEKTRAFMLQNGLRTIHDFGCGSGHKLVHILGEFETTGIDLPETIDRVQAQHPDRVWIGESFERVELPPADIVVSSDVIEHVQDPDALIRHLLKSTKKWVVLSTPAREIIYDDRNFRRFGPPDNPAHLREWTYKEFRSYISRHLNIVCHEITNWEQGTQMIIGSKSA